jgi:ketosteroid isomerase-like protein
MPAILALLDANVEWTEAERFPYYGGTWRGPEAIIKGLFEPLGRDWSSFAVNAEQFVTEGNEVVSLGRYIGTHRRTGRSVTAAFAHHWTVRDNKIVRFVQHTDTAKVLEVFTDNSTRWKQPLRLRFQIAISIGLVVPLPSEK